MPFKVKGYRSLRSTALPIFLRIFLPINLILNYADELTFKFTEEVQNLLFDKGLGLHHLEENQDKPDPYY